MGGMGVFIPLDREPIEDLRLDFEDGYGAGPTRLRTPTRSESPTAKAIGEGTAPAFVGLRFKCLEEPTGQVIGHNGQLLPREDEAMVRIHPTAEVAAWLILGREANRWRYVVPSRAAAPLRWPCSSRHPVRCRQERRHE
jgi:hypothetical protein